MLLGNAKSNIHTGSVHLPEGQGPLARKYIEHRNQTPEAPDKVRCGQIHNECRWRRLVAKFATNARGAMLLPNLV